MNIDEAAVPLRSPAELRAVVDARSARHRAHLRLRNGAVAAAIVVTIAVTASITAQSTAVRSIGPASSGDVQAAPTGGPESHDPEAERPTGDASTKTGTRPRGNAAAGGGPIPTTKPATSAPSDAQLLFNRRNEGLYVANADGSDMRRLDVGPGYGYSLSPDRRFVLWTNDGTLRVASIDSGTQDVLFEAKLDDNALDAAWMPDQKSVAFLRRVGHVKSTFELAMVDVATKATRRLRTVTSGSVPAVSRDGRIAYNCDVNRQSRLCLTNAASADLGFVPNSGHHNKYSWSPNGEWLAVTDFVAGAQRSAGVVALRVDGSERRELVRDDAPFRPDWLDDGHIAFGLLGPDPNHPDAERGIRSVSLEGVVQRLTTGADVLEDVG